MAGISQTKSYGVSYVIHADSTKLTTALKAAATEADMLQAHLTNAHTKMQALFGTGKDIPQTITKLNEAFNKWASAKSVNQSNPITTTENFVKSVEKAAKKLDKNFKKNPIISQEGLIGGDFLKTLQSQLSAKPLEITVKPILSANAHATLQEQLNTKEFTINVRANVTGIQQQKPGTAAPSLPTRSTKLNTSGLKYVPWSQMPNSAMKFKALYDSALKRYIQLEDDLKAANTGRETYLDQKRAKEEQLAKLKNQSGKRANELRNDIARINSILSKTNTNDIAQSYRQAKDNWASAAQMRKLYGEPNSVLVSNPNNVVSSSKKAYASPTAKASLSPIGQMQQSIKQFQNLAKSSTININGRWLGGELAQQVSVSLGNIQSLVNLRPILVKGRWLGGELAQQASMSLGNLQSLVSQRGISVLPKMPDSKGLNKTLADIQKLTSSKPIPIEGKLNTAKINEQIRAFKPSPIAIKANIGWGTGSASRVSQIKKLSEGLKPLSMSVNLDISKAKAKLQQLKTFAASMSPLNIGTTVASGNKGTTQAAVQSQVQRATTASMRASANSGPVASAMMGGRNNDLYTRMRKSWYPFTGNTSFGARTPMALDMAKGMGMMFAVSGVMQAVTNSFHQVAEYENMMKTVQAILKTNDGGANFSGRFKAMEEEVRRVGRETKFTAPEVAGAARFMAMAGLGIEDINAATNPIANLALVGDNDMSTTADKMTNIMTSFGLLKGLTGSQKKANMRHTSDVLTNTFTKSNTDLIQLAEAMQYAGPMSHLTGTSLEDAAAMVGVMGNAGIQSSMAGTTLRMMYQNIIKPNKKQAAEWKRLGINTKDDKGRNRDIFEILKDLRAKITGTTDLNSKVGADQLKIMGAEVMSLFRTTAGAGTAALLENLGEAINLAQSNRESNGVAQTIADEKKNTISGLWAQVTSTFTDQSVNTVNEFVETIKDMLRSLRDWLASKEAADTLRSIYDLAKSLIDVFGGVAKVWMKLYTFAPNVIKWFITIQMWATQMGFLVTPIIQVIGAITTLKNTLLGFVGSLAGASAMASRGRTAGVVNSVAGGLSPLSTGRPVAAKRHATRIVGNDVLLRGMSMGRFGYKGAFGAALQSGIAMGAWSGINGIKQIFQSLGLYLAKGIGLLMSPVGAVTAGLVTLGVTLYKVYEHVKEVNRQHEVAIINYQKMSDALSKDRENLINMGNAIGGFNVINSGYQREMSSTPTSYALPTEYTKGILNDTGKLLPSEIVKSYVSLYGKYLPSGTIETFLKRTPDYTSMSNYEDPHDLFGGATVKNEKGSKNAQRLAVVAQWAKFATEQDDVQKAARAILEAQSKGDLKQVHAILDQFKVPTNAKSMLSMNKNAEELSKLENADKTFEFMYAQLNYLKEIADKMDIPIQNYTKAMELIDELSKQKGKISSDSIKELSTTLLKAQSVSWRGKTGSLILGKDNKVDWLAMAKQFNESIPFTLAEQQQIMYDALDNIFDNENMDKIPEIATLVARYLPLLQNLTPFDSNGLSYTSNSIQSVANRIKDSQKHFTGMASENADERESMVKNIMQWIRSRKGDRGQDLTQQNIDNLYALLKKWGYDKKGHKIVAPEKNTSITPPGTSDQSAYDSKYNNHQARPTQIIFDIDNLVKFDNTQVNSLDQKGIAESVGRQMAEGLHLMFAQAASEFGIVAEHNG